MKVYIVGRISGDPDDYDHFHRAAESYHARMLQSVGNDK